MTLQNSAALWLLPPLFGVVVVLYVLKMRRRDVRVPATFLWPERVDEVRANALIQRLRPSWLLVLQLLAVCLVVLAFARPQTEERGLAGSATVIVLDASAGMSATDVRPSRFDEAVRIARDTIQSERAGDRLALIEAGTTPRVVFPLGNDPARQLLALEQVRATDAEGDVGEALRLAGALVGSTDGARIVLLSDGDFDPVQNFGHGKAAFVYRKIGEYDDNLAVSALGFADTPAGRHLYAGVKNYSAKPMEGTLSLYADGRAIYSMKTGAIAPMGQYGRTVAAPAGAHVFEANLQAPDALKSDNYAVCLADPGANLRVLLVSKGNPFLERALTLDPRVTLDRSPEIPLDEKATPIGGKGPAPGRYDIVIFDGIPEEPVKARGVLTFGAAGIGSPVTDAGLVPAGAFVSAEDRPLLRGVDFRGVYLERQHRVTARDTGEVLAQTKVGPLVVASLSPGRRQVYVAFEPLQSDFPLQVGFPIFVANALDYLGGDQSSDLIAVRAGVPFAVPITAEATLTAPDGSQTHLKPTGAALVVRTVNRVGVYTLQIGSRRKTIYAYLRSDRASDIAPVKEISLGGGKVSASVAPLQFADFWRPLVLLGLLVLSGEWWLFARKS